MTLQNFIQNPTGPSTTYFARRDIVKKNLEQRFSNLMRINGRIDFRVYKIQDTYLLHFKIPSEEFGNDIKYDACIQFTPESEDAKTENRLFNYNIRLFSNSPAFTFTYAYVVYNSDMMVDILAHKFNEKALTDEPKIRNPLEILGFEKSCYFSALYIKNLDFLYKPALDRNLSKWNEKLFLAGIRTDRGKLEELNKLKHLKSLEKKIEIAKKKKIKIMSKLNPKKKGYLKKPGTKGAVKNR